MRDRAWRPRACASAGCPRGAPRGAAVTRHLGIFNHGRRLSRSRGRPTCGLRFGGWGQRPPGHRRLPSGGRRERESSRGPLCLRAPIPFTRPPPDTVTVGVRLPQTDLGAPRRHANPRAVWSPAVAQHGGTSGEHLLGRGGEGRQAPASGHPTRPRGLRTEPGLPSVHGEPLAGAVPARGPLLGQPAARRPLGPARQAAAGPGVCLL